jgi:dihydroorotate dehydrogenase
MIYERWARPVLFRLGDGDAESAHEWTLRRLARLSASPRWLAGLRRALAVPPAPSEVFGLRFPNPVGLAAGMDKDGLALRAWPALGFGFVEVGTVTWHAQPGNDRPRVFRLRSSEAVINRMGFNNGGAAALADRISTLPPGSLGVPLGVSLGKSKVTPLDEAVDDYLESFRALYPYGDYLAVNVSSPNTPGLRTLQDRGHLTELLAALRAEAGRLLMAGALSAAVPSAVALRGGEPPSGPKPILVKIAPDLTEQAIADLLEVCLEHGVAGVIATNTTLSRSGLAPTDVMIGEQAGGLSGAPLAARAREVVAFVHRETSGVLPIVGVGGILSADDAVRLMDAGASLVQLYTGLIYRGPRLIRDIVRHLPRSRTISRDLGGKPVVRSLSAGLTPRSPRGSRQVRR